MVPDSCQSETPTSEVDEPLRSRDRGSLTYGDAVGSWTPLIIEWFIANWMFLGAGVLVGLALGWVVQLRQPARFVAEALITPARTRTQVQFESSIKTVSDSVTDKSGSGALAPAGPERLLSLAELVNNGTVEAQVISKLVGSLPSSELQPGQLKARIHGALKPRTEIISIQADASDPAQAIALANAWATSYTDVVNRLYASGDSADTVQALENQRDQAFAVQQAAQTAYSASLRDTRADELTREINEKESRLALLYRAGRLDAADPAKSGAAPSGLDDYRLVEIRTINDLAQTLRRLDITRARIQYLLGKPSLGPSDMSAVSLAEMQLVAIADALPGQTQLQVQAPSTGDFETDLSQLIASIDRARTLVAEEFQTRQSQYEAARINEVRELEDEVRTMHAELENLTSGQKQQLLQRDLALDTYSALARKLEERKVAEAAAGHEVEIAGAATVASAAARATGLSEAVWAIAGGATVALIVLARSSRVRWRALLPHRVRTPLTAS